MTTAPAVFVSHSHADKATAEELARGLRLVGVDAWFDKWEIQPGDSLTQRIFADGLTRCAVFIVLLSPDSVNSKWVREELDIALIRRIEDATRIIPVVARPCSIPTALRALLRLDLATSSADEVVRQIADVAFGRSAKPPIQPAPQFSHRIDGLSQDAVRVSVVLAPLLTQHLHPSVEPRALATHLGMTPEQLNDAAEELQEYGLVCLDRFLGTHPFSFGAISPQYELVHRVHGSGVLDFDPLHDILVVAACVVAERNVVGARMQTQTALSPQRINLAVAFLDDRGLAKVLRSLGTAPFSFMAIEATSATRRFVQQNGT